MRAREFANFNFDIEPYEAWSGEGVIVHAYDGKEEIGHVVFEPTDHDVTQWYAVDVEVEEPYQRLGIATKMYNMAKQAAKAQGAIIVRSHTQTDNGRSLWGDKRVWESQETKSREDVEGMTIEMTKHGHQLVINALDDWGNKLLGHVIFNIGDGNELDPQELEVVDQYQGQGIARVMYDYVKSKGYKIIRSWDQTDAGAGFWNKHRGEDVRVWEDELNEVNIDTEHNQDELTVKQKFIDYFTKKGYKILGEGRDQIALLSPRDTVLKILGLGEQVRQQSVEDYVDFFVRNQRNPYYPRIYNSQRFEFEGDSYFMYETEYLDYVSNEDDTLDWLERYLNHLGTDPVEAQNYIEVNGVPDDIGEDQLYGLTQSTEDIIEYLAGPKGYMMDLGNIENIRRRNDGHLVIVDPISI